MLIILTLCVLLQEQPASTPEAALKAYQKAIESSDAEAFARLTAGPAGTTLRALAPALKKVQIASEALTKALGEKPALNTSNPFANELNPLQGYRFELIELTKSKDDYLARVRFGLANRLQEETVIIKKEGNTYRISAPGTFLKSLKEMTPERLKKQVDSINALTGILTRLAEQVSKGELSSKESILLKLAKDIKEAGIAELK